MKRVLPTAFEPDPIPKENNELTNDEDQCIGTSSKDPDAQSLVSLKPAHEQTGDKLKWRRSNSKTPLEQRVSRSEKTRSAAKNSKTTK